MIDEPPGEHAGPSEEALQKALAEHRPQRSAPETREELLASLRVGDDDLRGAKSTEESVADLALQLPEAALHYSLLRDARQAPLPGAPLPASAVQPVSGALARLLRSRGPGNNGPASSQS